VIISIIIITDQLTNWLSDQLTILVQNKQNAEDYNFVWLSLHLPKPAPYFLTVTISQIHVLTGSLVTRRNVLHFSIQWLLLNSVSLYRIQSIIRSGQKVSYHNTKFISNTSLVLALSLSCFAILSRKMCGCMTERGRELDNLSSTTVPVSQLHVSSWKGLPEGQDCLSLWNIMNKEMK